MTRASKILRQRNRSANRTRALEERQKQQERERERRAQAPEKAAAALRYQESRRRKEEELNGIIDRILETADELDYPGAELVTLNRRLHPFLLKKTLAGWHLTGTSEERPIFITDAETGTDTLVNVRYTNTAFYLVEDGRIVRSHESSTVPAFNLSSRERWNFDHSDGPNSGKTIPRYRNARKGSSVRRAFASRVADDIRDFEDELRDLLQFLETFSEV